MRDSDALVGNNQEQKQETPKSNDSMFKEIFSAPAMRSNLLTVDSETPVTQFVGGLYDGAIARPIQAVKQMTGGTEAAPPTLRQDTLKPTPTNRPPESGYTTAGQIVGSMVPFVALAAVTRGAGNAMFGKLEEQTLRRTVAEQMVSGFALGSLLTPSELKPGESLIEARVKTGAKDAAVFGSMALTAGFLTKAFPGAAQPDIAEKIGSTVARRVGIGATSGAVGGFLDAEIRTGGNATGAELLASMAGYAAFGGLMEGGNVLAKRYFAANQSLEAQRGQDNARASQRDLIDPAAAERMQLSAARLATQDPNAFVIDSFGGWYDKLGKAVRTAQSGQTIIVTDQKWFKEGELMLRRANRTDVNLILASPEGAAQSVASAAKSIAQPSDRSAVRAASDKVEAASPSSYVMDRPTLATAIEREVLKSGLDPADALVAALKKNRVLMIGEYHTPDNPHREFGAQLISRLQKEGATHLAIEHSSTHKGKVFKADGEINTDQFSTFMNQREYHRLLLNARKSGMDVVPVDSAESTLAPILAKLAPQLKGRDVGEINRANTAATLTQRNLDMADNIMKILEDPKAKVVFWVGNYHLNTTPMPGEGAQVAQLLRDRKVKVATFASQHDGYWSSEPMRDIYAPPQTYAVPMKEAPILGRQTMQNKNEEGADRLFFQQYDFLVMYPKKGYTYD